MVKGLCRQRHKGLWVPPLQPALQACGYGEPGGRPAGGGGWPTTVRLHAACCCQARSSAGGAKAVEPAQAARRARRQQAAGGGGWCCQGTCCRRHANSPHSSAGCCWSLRRRLAAGAHAGGWTGSRAPATPIVAPLGHTEHHPWAPQKACKRLGGPKVTPFVRIPGQPGRSILGLPDERNEAPTPLVSCTGRQDF